MGWIGARRGGREEEKERLRGRGGGGRLRPLVFTSITSYTACVFAIDTFYVRSIDCHCSGHIHTHCPVKSARKRSVPDVKLLVLSPRGTQHRIFQRFVIRQGIGGVFSLQVLEDDDDDKEEPSSQKWGSDSNKD